jgi:hypothetical protein
MFKFRFNCFFLGMVTENFINGRVRIHIFQVQLRTSIKQQYKKQNSKNKQHKLERTILFINFNKCKFVRNIPHSAIWIQI